MKRHRDSAEIIAENERLIEDARREAQRLRDDRVRSAVLIARARRALSRLARRS